jgi:hypothetical protein
VADLSSEPIRFYKGETVVWTRAVSDYPPGGSWTLRYEFAALDGSHHATVDATADGTDWKLTLASDASGAFSIGGYKWRCYVTDGGAPAEVHHIDSGRFEVLDPLDSAADRRSWIEGALDAIRARIEGRATESHSSYSIGSRSVGELSHEELLQAEATLQERLNRLLADERVAAGGTRPRIRFRLW